MTLYAPSVEKIYVGKFIIEQYRRSWIASLNKTFVNDPINDLHIIAMQRETTAVEGYFSPPINASDNARYPTDKPTIELFDIVFYMTDKKRVWRYELKEERDNDYNKLMSYGRQLPKLEDNVPEEAPEPNNPTD